MKSSNTSMLVLLIIATFGLVIGLSLTFAGGTFFTVAQLIGPALFVIGGIALVVWLAINAIVWERESAAKSSARQSARP